MSLNMIAEGCRATVGRVAISGIASNQGPGASIGRAIAGAHATRGEGYARWKRPSLRHQQAVVSYSHGMVPSLKALRALTVVTAEGSFVRMLSLQLR